MSSVWAVEEQRALSRLGWVNLQVGQLCQRSCQVIAVVWRTWDEAHHLPPGEKLSSNLAGKAGGERMPSDENGQRPTSPRRKQLLNPCMTAGHFASFASLLGVQSGSSGPNPL